MAESASIFRLPSKPSPVEVLPTAVVDALAERNERDLQSLRRTLKLALEDAELAELRISGHPAAPFIGDEFEAEVLAYVAANAPPALNPLTEDVGPVLFTSPTADEEEAAGEIQPSAEQPAPMSPVIDLPLTFGSRPDPQPSKPPGDTVVSDRAGRDTEQLNPESPVSGDPAASSKGPKLHNLPTVDPDAGSTAPRPRTVVVRRSAPTSNQSAADEVRETYASRERGAFPDGGAFPDTGAIRDTGLSPGTNLLTDAGAFRDAPAPSANAHTEVGRAVGFSSTDPSLSTDSTNTVAASAGWGGLHETEAVPFPVAGPVPLRPDPAPLATGDSYDEFWEGEEGTQATKAAWYKKIPANLLMQVGVAMVVVALLLLKLG